MIKKKITFAFIFSFIIAVLITSGLFVGSEVFAQGVIQNGFDRAGNIGGSDIGTTDIRDVIVNIVNIALGFLGILAIVIILYVVFLWMTAGGNQDQIARARRTLINATIGLAIILLSWSIALFVIRSLGGATGGDLCNVGDIRTSGPGGCAVRTCIAPDTWGPRDTSSCPEPPGTGSFRVVNRYPEGNINAALCVLITAEFNNEVNNDTLIAGTNVNVHECIGAEPQPCLVRGAALAGTATSLNSSGENSRFLEFNASVDLNINSKYLVELVSNSGGGIRSVDNEHLGGSETWTFTTGATGDNTPPTVIFTDPADGDTNICLAKTIRVDFSETMLRSSLLDDAAFSVGPGPVPTFSKRVVSGNTRFSATPRTLFEESTNFIPVLNGAVVRDSCGNFLDGDSNGSAGGDYTWSFDTGTTARCTPEISGIVGTGLYDTDTAPADANVVTIDGNDFGSTGEVIFENKVSTLANDVCLSDGAGEYQPTRSCFVSWDPTEVQVYIPAATGGSNGAITGDVVIRSGDNNLTSNPAVFPIISPHVSALSTGRSRGGLPAAGIGQFMTVSGSNFGPVQGLSEIYFVNKADPSIRILADVQCGVSGWDTEQIIISPPEAMPPGISSGERWLVQIWKDGGAETHRSNVAEFIYDDGTPGPGLCRIDPDKGRGDAIVVIEGEKFELFPDPGLVAVAFGNESSSAPAGGTPTLSMFALAPDEITGVSVPNIAPRNNVGVFISDGTLVSNSLNFDVLATGEVPVILDFTPTEGGEGQYVTIIGTNFGNAEGNVYLSVDETTAADELWEVFNPALFPAECQGGLWNDSQIIIKIPPGVIPNGSYFIIVERAHDLAIGTSAALVPPQFRVDNLLPPSPNICLLEPANGNPGTPVAIFGENLGAAGNVRFYNNRNATVINSWSDERVDAEAPDFIETGPLVVEVGGLDSNPLQFSVGLCTSPGFICGGGTSSCCGDGKFEGQCRTDIAPGISSCDGLENQCVQSWSFETEVGPGRNCNAGPGPACVVAPVCGPSLVCDTNVGCTCQDFGVVVSTNCNGSLEQSPSPKNREKNACVNSKFNVRFNSEIAPLPFQAIKLEECNDSTCAGASLTPIALDILPRVSSSQFLPPVPDTIQAVLPPGTLLNPDTWHRVTIREGPTGVVTAITSIEMPEDFGWIFKTKDDPAPCVASRCALDPRKGAEVEKIGDTYAFTLTEVFGSCNLITTDTPYDVVSSDNAIATVAPTPINIVPPAVTTATAVAKGRIDVITTNQVNPVVTCKANFTVDTQVPKVVERYPDCITACTNATIGARFNLGVLKTDLTPGGTINLFSCGTDPTCGVRVPVAIDPVLIFVDDPAHAVPPPNLYTTQVSFGSVVPLNEDEYYQVELNAGSIFGASGESLKENTTGGLYQWVFKTKISDGSGLCSVDHINVAPGEITARVTGISHAFTGEAYSAPDECSVRGQRLVATNFNWSDPASPAPYFGWAPPNTPPQVGFIDTPLLDINPADSSTDPVQNFITDGTDPACNSGVCSTTVVATVEPGGGEPAIACTDAGSECGIVNLRCGYQRDEQCSEVPPIGIGLGAGYGVSYTSCCSARPQIDFGLTNPTDGEKNFCRNGVAKVVFNKAIDTASISGNIFLVKNVKSGICPVGLRSLLVKNDSSTHFVRIAPPEGLMNKVVYYIEKFFSSIFGTKADAAYVAGNLCLVPANIILRTDGSGVRNEVHITPRSLLDITAGGQEYAIVILGDTDPLDGEKVGVRSKDGVTFVGTTPFDRAGKSFMSEIISFETKPEICKIARIDHNFAKGPVFGDPIMRTNTTERFFCAGDTCRDDILDATTGWSVLTGSMPNNAGSQHYLEVEAFDVEGTTLNTDFTYFESGPNFFNRELTGAATDEESVITVDDALSGFAKDVRGNLTVIAKNPAEPSNILAKTLGIHLFSCQNPWPDLDSFPYRDAETSFEFYYCRDDGAPGTADDLPALDPSPVEVGTTPSLVCYGGGLPNATCSFQGAGDPACACLPESRNCISDGFCAPAGLKDVIFNREGIPRAPTLDSLSIPGISQTGGEVEISWTDNSAGSADGFNIYWGDAEGRYPFSLDVHFPAGLTATIPGLENGKEYFFAVSAYTRSGLISGGGESSYSNFNSIVVTDLVPPLGPVGFDVQSTIPGVVDATWGRGNCSITVADTCSVASDCPIAESCNIDPDISGYRLYIGTTSGTYLEVRDVGQETRTSLNLGTGVEYFFNLQSYDSDGNPPDGDISQSMSGELSVVVL